MTDETMTWFDHEPARLGERHMRTCPDCRHEPHPGITCGQTLPGAPCPCQTPPCQHLAFCSVREFGGIGGFGKVVGYVCIDCRGPFEVNEVTAATRSAPEETP